MQLSRKIEQDGIEAEAAYGADDFDTPEGMEHMDPWTVTLTWRGRTLVVPFYTGEGLRSQMTDGPAALSVLSALLLDSYADDVTFEDWAGEFGYDTDSRSAERTYDACREEAAKLREFLGAEFDAYRQAENDA
jgi:hypothetical protein